jgi:hypothetical protein
MDPARRLRYQAGNGSEGETRCPAMVTRNR